jgi:2-polyprenyl-6-methoxyphenol hydroxylase-like FAD-dependent oxidoreductase
VDAADGYHWYGAGSAAGVIPTNDGMACVFAATSAERLRREPDRGADAAWRRILGQAAPGLAERLEHRRPAGSPRVFPGLTGYLREAAGPGWALVGDAGYFKDPITAHASPTPCVTARSWPAWSHPPVPMLSAATRPNATSFRSVCFA